MYERKKAILFFSDLFLLLILALSLALMLGDFSREVLCLVAGCYVVAAGLIFVSPARYRPPFVLLCLIQICLSFRIASVRSVLLHGFDAKGEMVGQTFLGGTTSFLGYGVLLTVALVPFLFFVVRELRKKGISIGNEDIYRFKKGITICYLLLTFECFVAGPMVGVWFKGRSLSQSAEVFGPSAIGETVLGLFVFLAMYLVCQKGAEGAATPLGGR